ncbi:MAG: YceD family protein [Rubrivivax sp.]|nr:YceD family protein [Rubrivivax sp.]
MKERGPDPRALDVMALCKAAGTLKGQWPLAALARLSASLCAASDGNATWQARGWLVPALGGEPEVWLELQGDAEVPLECQRCLQPMKERLTVQRRFRFVRNEDDAARLDEESEDDVLALPARLDLQALLEDELILTLPIVPRHGVCPEPLPLPAAAPLEEEAPAPNPFAALAALRRPPGGG